VGAIMPQIQQYGTSNVLACWQGGTIEGVLFTRAAFQCTLKLITAAANSQAFNLAINVDLDDEDTLVKLCVYGVQESDQANRIVWQTNGSASISIATESGDSLPDPLFFNILVTQCTDFVSAIEGPPGNP